MWTAWTPTSRGQKAREPRSSRSLRTTRMAGSTEPKTSKAIAGCSSRSTDSSRAAALQELRDGLVTFFARVVGRRRPVVAGRLRARPRIEQHLHDCDISVRSRLVERGVIRLAADVGIAMGGEQRLHQIGMVARDRGIERGVREAARLLEIHVGAVLEEDLRCVEMPEERGQAEGRKALGTPGVHARPGLSEDRLEPSRVSGRCGLMEAERVFGGPFKEEAKCLGGPMIDCREDERSVRRSHPQERGILVEDRPRPYRIVLSDRRYEFFLLRHRLRLKAEADGRRRVRT